MREKLLAYTAPDGVYPGFVSIDRLGNGDVEVTVRAAGQSYESLHVCADPADAGQGRCTPGGPSCNNYCGKAPDKGPQQLLPLPCQNQMPGAQATFTVPADQWRGVP